MKKLHAWMAEPLVMPRWMLYVIYVLFAVLGLVLVAGTNTAVGDSVDDYPPYGMAISITSTVALFASSIRHRNGITPDTVWYRFTECLACLVLFALLSTYIAYTVGPWLAGDTDTGAIGIVVTIASLLPIFRWIVLGNGIIRYWAAR